MPPSASAPASANVGKFICIGLNYADHAAETGAPIPAEPIIFMKATSAIIGPNDDVIIPKNSIKPDWEVELAIVIGKEARYVEEADAMDHVAGYCVCNDVSERHFQTERGGQWDKGKGCDTFGPIGPWMVTRDEVADPQNLSMWLEVDGHRYQNGSTRTMIFGVAHVVAYVSQFMSLQPGDIISTGTPPGVGMGIKPEPVWLKPGNVMRSGHRGAGRADAEREGVFGLDFCSRHPPPCGEVGEGEGWPPISGLSHPLPPSPVEGEVPSGGFGSIALYAGGCGKTEARSGPFRHHIDLHQRPHGQRRDPDRGPARQFPGLEEILVGLVHRRVVAVELGQINPHENHILQR